MGLKATDLRRVPTGIKRRLLAELAEHSLTASQAQWNPRGIKAVSPEVDLTKDSRNDLTSYLWAKKIYLFLVFGVANHLRRTTRHFLKGLPEPLYQVKYLRFALS